MPGGIRHRPMDADVAGREARGGQLVRRNAAAQMQNQEHGLRQAPGPGEAGRAGQREERSEY